MFPRPLCTIRLLTVVAVFGLGMFWPKHSHARDPWYSDMSGHWSERYVRMLWSEDVADGYVVTRWFRRASERYQKTTSTFKPDEGATRAHHALLVAKVFRLLPFDNPVPTFKDVPRSYLAYRGKPGYGYVEAAHAAGFLFSGDNCLFRPDAGVSRQDAVASLIRSLSLEPYALSLPAKDINRLLDRFKDQKTIDASIRPHLAVATRLKVVEGYPDGTLKPARHMTRAEAAAIVYRSCLIRADAMPDTFFPEDADAPDNHTDVALFSLKNSNARSWSLCFRDLGGKIVALFEAGKSGRTGTVDVPQSVTWDGRDSRGRVLPLGTYFYQASVVDTQGQVHSSVSKPITIAERSLKASLSPSRVSYLEVVEVCAHTTGWAEQVLLSISTEASIALKPVGTPSSYSNVWTGSFVVSNQGPGIYTIGVTAVYGVIERTQTLTYEVCREASSAFPEPPSNPLESVLFTLID